MISVLGEGVAGLCAATALAERGLTLEVIRPEAAPPPASQLAGGMLAPHCEGAEAPDGAMLRGMCAADWWAARVPGVRRSGTLVLAAPRDACDLEQFARATTGHVRVDPGSLEPDLNGRFARGLFYAAEAHLDPEKALQTLRSSLERRGVAFHGGAARGRVVDCRGLAASDRLSDLRPVRGEVVCVRAPGVALTRTIRLLHPRFPCYVVPRGDGRYLIGATMVESARSGGITARAVVELLSAAYTVHPGFAEAEVVNTGAGHRPAFPDNLPAIRHDGSRLHLNGFYRHGFLLAPALAEELANLVASEVGHAH